MIIEVVAAAAVGIIALAGIGFLVAHALADYKSKSEVTQRILEKYMLDNKLKVIEPVKPNTNPNPPR
jgi:hypothetical protein